MGPWHTHDEVQPLIPGELVELDVEIWPTSIVVPAGYRVGLSVRGIDYEFEGADEPAELSHFKGSKMRGVGIYTHADPGHRPADVYGGTTTLHAGPDYPSSLLLPVIPPSDPSQSHLWFDVESNEHCRIVVMYLGVIAKVGRAEAVFRDPRHPYTEALLAANPSLNDDDDGAIRLTGSVPDPSAPPEGCRFHTRCQVVTGRCGWDVSDVMRILEERGHSLDGLKGVERATPFDGTCRSSPANRRPPSSRI